MGGIENGNENENRLTPVGANPENKVSQSHAERIFKSIDVQDLQDKTHREIMTMVLKMSLEDPEIAKTFKGMLIRGITQSAVTAKEVLAMLGEDPEMIKLMAIGDIDLPDFIRPEVDKIVTDSGPMLTAITKKHGNGYELAGNGIDEVRAMAFDKWDPYYGFSANPDLQKTLTERSTITNGGMGALMTIVGAFNEAAREKQLKKRYVGPDNCFATWPAIINKSADKKDVECIKLGTRQEDRLQLTPELVDKFYAENPSTGYDDTWYITPVNNPSGTKMTPEQLTQTCEAILKNNPKASIVLDCVYVRTMEVKAANEMMSGVIKNPTLMDRIIFIESLSKTHGMTGHRLGMCFTQSKELYTDFQNTDNTNLAGHGYAPSSLIEAAMSTTPEVDEKFKDLHRFWQKERLGVYNYLTSTYPDLFDENQSHIDNNGDKSQLEEPLGLYVLLKLKPGVDPYQVFYQTGCVGVPSKLATGTYMRFSIGKITKPTFSQYATAA